MYKIRLGQKVVSVLAMFCLTISLVPVLGVSKADEFAYPSEDGYYVYDETGYHKIDESNPFTKAMYDDAVKGNAGQSDTDVELIEGGSSTSLDNDALWELYVKYNDVVQDVASDVTNESDVTGSADYSNSAEVFGSKNATEEQPRNKYTVENGYPEGMEEWYDENGLADWSDEDWALAKLVIDTSYITDLNTFAPFYDIDMRSELAEMKKDNYFILRVCVPYDSCGNLSQDKIVTHQVLVPKNKTAYLDEVLKEDDKNSKYSFDENALIFREHYTFRKSVDTYSHTKVSSDLVVITRYQVANTNMTVDDYSSVKGNELRSTGEVTIKNVAPNLWFLFSKYIDLRICSYSLKCKNSAYLPSGKGMKIYHKKRAMSPKPTKVYSISSIVQKSNEYAAKHTGYKKYTGWSITPFELYLQKLK